MDIRKYEDFKLLFKIATLCNNSNLKRGDKNIPGLLRVNDEGALSVVAAKAGI